MKVNAAHVEQQTVEIALPGHAAIVAEPSAFQWVELFMPAVLVMLSIVVPAYIGYMVVKAKVDKRNAVKRRAYEESAEPTDAELGEETVMKFIRDEITRRKGE